MDILEFFEKQEKKTYSPKVVGEILNLSEPEVVKMCEKGKFPGAKLLVNGKWQIPSALFRVNLEEVRQMRENLNDIRKKAKNGGQVDEFEL